MTETQQYFRRLNQHRRRNRAEIAAQAASGRNPTLFVPNPKPEPDDEPKPEPDDGGENGEGDTAAE